MAKKARSGPGPGGREVPKKHYCPKHDVECKGVMVMPKRRMKYICPQGCELGKGRTVLR